MKLFILSILATLSTSQVFAAFNEPLQIKKISDDGNSFVFVRKEGAPPWNGITIKDPQTKATLYEARVLKCSATSCLAQIVKNKSGIAFREDEEYLHSYNEKPIEYDAKAVTAPLKDVKVEPKPVVTEVKPEPPPAPVVAKPEPKPVPKVEKIPEPKKVEEPEKKDNSPKLSEGYLAYGSPMGPGITLGYLKIKNDLRYGVNYGNISSTTNDVSLKGHLLSGVLLYNALKPTASTDVNLLLQLGLAKATLDFSAVNEDGPSKDETTYFAALGGEGRYHLGQFSFAAKMGAAKSGLADNYEGEINRYNNPYGTILVFLEIGFYYQF